MCVTLGPGATVREWMFREEVAVLRVAVLSVTQSLVSICKKMCDSLGRGKSRLSGREAALFCVRVLAAVQAKEGILQRSGCPKNGLFGTSILLRD